MRERARRLAHGDPSAFAELYDACADRVHHYLLVRLGSPADADDVLQETFVRLARTREKLATVENLVAYVFAAARNEAIRRLERREREGRERAAPSHQALFQPAPGGDRVPPLGDLGLPSDATTDPFDGEPLRVKNAPRGWMVYSVGRNGVDDGGQFEHAADVGVGPVNPEEAPKKP